MRPRAGGAGGRCRRDFGPTTAGAGAEVGDRVRVWPAHVDPTVALHEAMWLVDGDEVLDRWAVDLRNW